MTYLTPERPRRSTFKTGLLVGIPIIFFLALALVMLREKENPEVTYFKSLMSAEKHEYASPTQFLKPTGTYRKTLLGTKYRIEGSITNTATTAVYKDVVVEVSYYSKTKTRISSEQVTVYDIFPPKAVKNFDVKVAAPKATEIIGWEVVDATRN